MQDDTLVFTALNVTYRPPGQRGHPAWVHGLWGGLPVVIGTGWSEGAEIAQQLTAAEGRPVLCVAPRSVLMWARMRHVDSPEMPAVGFDAATRPLR